MDFCAAASLTESAWPLPGASSVCRPTRDSVGWRGASAVLACLAGQRSWPARRVSGFGLPGVAAYRQM
jgi:hypothetical protein